MLSQTRLRQALDQQPLFENKSWQLSPMAWPLDEETVHELEAIGQASLEFHQALETLYLRSAQNRNLLRNRKLQAPWVADYLDRGKPAWLVELGRNKANRGCLPPVLRPDLLLTAQGFALTELDSVPGGIGLTAFLNRLYQDGGDLDILGRDDAMIKGFHQSLAALVPSHHNPLIAIVVSEEAATYRPEMIWLAEQLQRRGKRVHVLSPEELFPLGGALYFDVEGNPEKIDLIYRFFELFDLPSLPLCTHLMEALENGEVVVSPPLRPFQEEKSAHALFHHHLLRDFWEENLSRKSLQLLRKIMPVSWIMDPTPLPPSAILDGPKVGGRGLNDWMDLAAASQKERDLLIKISGFHETAWGARGVLLGSDCSRQVWTEGIESALAESKEQIYILQEFRKPSRVRHEVYQKEEIQEVEGRLRLCPYYFLLEDTPKLAGALATFCPPDKKIIHGMQDAALLPSTVIRKQKVP